MRARAIVSYDGSDYAGSQRQADVPTVQGALEEALAQVAQETVTVLAAGRTDAGVHAIGQVIVFDVPWRHGLGELQRAMNAVLPSDIAVRQLEEAAPGFHPRFDARRRHYRYNIHHGAVRSPLARRYSLHVPYPLDVEMMDEAAQILFGEHDFATFGQPPQGEITVRHVFRASWSEHDDGWPCFSSQDGATLLRFDIEANAFLYRMVRSIVGTLLDVGQGRMSMSEFREAFASCERGRAGQTAAPHGLCLIEVTY
jgi:tRNA pseudouridine38-40 synthase